jgi:hypothetical protein
VDGHHIVRPSSRFRDEDAVTLALAAITPGQLGRLVPPLRIGHINHTKGAYTTQDQLTGCVNSNVAELLLAATGKLEIPQSRSVRIKRRQPDREILFRSGLLEQSQNCDQWVHTRSDTNNTQDAGSKKGSEKVKEGNEQHKQCSAPRERNTGSYARSNNFGACRYDQQ